jgi:hypothetical protein
LICGAEDGHGQALAASCRYAVLGWPWVWEVGHVAQARWVRARQTSECRLLREPEVGPRRIKCFLIRWWYRIGHG